jgi:hypothetical protein
MIIAFNKANKPKVGFLKYSFMKMGAIIVNCNNDAKNQVIGWH